MGNNPSGKVGMKPKKPLTDSVRYRSFIFERDQALEVILNRHLYATHVVIDNLKQKVITLVSAVYAHHVNFPTRQNLRGIEDRLTPDFNLASMRLSILAERLRKSAYMLTHLGEAEAIARALGKVQNHYVPKEKLEQVRQKPMPSDGSIEARVHLAISRLHRDVMDAIQTSLVRESALPEALERIEKVFPRVVTYQRAPRVLKNRKLAEANIPDLLKAYKLAKGEDPPTLTTGVFDSDQWDEVVKDYLSTELPNDIFRRGPNDQMIFFDVKEEGDVEFTKRYEWELEQEMTEDFVTQVREGSVDAAKENGINDFVWIAIVDSKTDECCFARDGLTSSEIESELKNGKLSEDECDAIVPPAHFNCRCKAAPMSEDMPEETPPDFGDFSDWLKEKANQG